MYFTLPETENRSLEDIEMHFSAKNRKITDVYIEKNVAQQLFKEQQKAIEAASENKHLQ